MAYSDKERFATEDAMRVGRLHCLTEGWLANQLSGIRGEGYAVSRLIPQLKMKTLVLWGARDEILDPKEAERFEKEIPNVKVKMIADCGHVPHLERPEEMAKLMREWLDESA